MLILISDTHLHSGVIKPLKQTLHNQPLTGIHSKLVLKTVPPKVAEILYTAEVYGIWPMHIFLRLVKNLCQYRVVPAYFLLAGQLGKSALA